MRTLLIQIKIAMTAAIETFVRERFGITVDCWTVHYADSCGFLQHLPAGPGFLTFGKESRTQDWAVWGFGRYLLLTR